MTTRTIFLRWLGVQNPEPSPTGLTVQTPTGIIHPPKKQAALVPQKPDPIIITQRPPKIDVKTETLSGFLRTGRQYHALCREKFVEKIITGFYLYERKEEFRTCALAAAYAGAFGPGSIENESFSKSMALWRLSRKLGYDVEKFPVVGPTGRSNSLADEIICLVDKDGWSRQGVVEWLESIGL